jgi:hypothetical protein
VYDWTPTKSSPLAASRKEVFARVSPESRHVLGSLFGLEALIGDGPPDEEVIDGPHHVDGTAMGSNQRL